MTVICVMGFGRSGTSMVSNILSHSGFFFGEQHELMPPTEHNPVGFFENMRFYQLNERILKSLGASWRSPRAVDCSRISSSFYREAEKLADAMRLHKNWAWKDPRNTILFDFWRRIVPEAKVVFCIRKPHEASQSMKKMGLPTLAEGLRLWRIYNEIGLSATENTPRLVVCHAHFFGEQRDSELRKLFEFAEVESGIAPVFDELYRQKQDVADPYTEYYKDIYQRFF